MEADYLRKFYLNLNSIIDDIDIDQSIYFDLLKLDDIVSYKIYNRNEIENFLIKMVKNKIKDTLRRNNASTIPYLIYLDKCNREIHPPDHVDVLNRQLISLDFNNTSSIAYSNDSSKCSNRLVDNSINVDNATRESSIVFLDDVS